MALNNVAGRAGQKRSRDEIRVRDIHVKFDDVKADGTFSGYGSVFGNVDAYREVVMPGAFAESLADLKSNDQILPVLWNHRSDEPIGYYTAIREDARGLFVEGKLLIEDVARAREVAALIRVKAVTGLSIGYWVLDDSYNEEERLTQLKKLKLREISVVTFPANDDARIETIKMKLAAGTQPTIREFEKLLRDAGFSRSAATSIAADGYGAFTRNQGEPDGKKAAVLSAIDSVNQLFN